MKIIAIGLPGHRSEVASRPVPPAVEWVWADAPADMANMGHADLYIDLRFDMQKGRIDALGRLPGPVIVHSVVHTLGEIRTLSAGSRPVGRINAWPGFLKRTEWELAASGLTEGTELTSLLATAGIPCRVVPDIPGMIGARILSSIINEAYFTLQDKVSRKEDIDVAMRLGTNYPLGPFEWADRIGLPLIHDLLSTLGRTDSRYIPAAALEQELAGLKSG